MSDDRWITDPWTRDQSAPGPETPGWRPDLSAYRRRRCVARLATVTVAVPLGWFALTMAVILRRGGDTRFGMVAYVAFVVVAATGIAVLVPLWRRTREARRTALPPIDAEEPEPGPHLGLSGAVTPPSRW